MHLYGFIGLGRKRLDVGILAGESFFGEKRIVLFMICEPSAGLEKIRAIKPPATDPPMPITVVSMNPMCCTPGMSARAISPTMETGNERPDNMEILDLPIFHHEGEGMRNNTPGIYSFP